MECAVPDRRSRRYACVVAVLVALTSAAVILTFKMRLAVSAVITLQGMETRFPPKPRIALTRAEMPVRFPLDSPTMMLSMLPPQVLPWKPPGNARTLRICEPRFDTASAK